MSNLQSVTQQSSPPHITARHEAMYSKMVLRHALVMSSSLAVGSVGFMLLFMAFFAAIVDKSLTRFFTLLGNQQAWFVFALVALLIFLGAYIVTRINQQEKFYATFGGGASMRKWTYETGFPVLDFPVVEIQGGSGAAKFAEPRTGSFSVWLRDVMETGSRVEFSANEARKRSFDDDDFRILIEQLRSIGWLHSQADGNGVHRMTTHGIGEALTWLS